jgi:hypothetical protein
MDRVKGLKCRECGRGYPSSPIHVCEFCFGPLEVDYDDAAIRARVSRARIEAGPPSIWRYADLLPLDVPDGEPPIGPHVGFTPLVRARNLAREWGVRELYVKNDAVCHPTCSFKDRVVAVALPAGAVFVAGAVIGVAADQLAAGPAGPGPAGCSGVQTCSAALVLTLSAVSRSCPIPAKTARSTTTGASLMRSLTCGIGMSHLSLACVPAIPLAGPAPARGESILPWRPVHRSSGPMFVRIKTGVRRRGRGRSRGWRAALP